MNDMNSWHEDSELSLRDFVYHSLKQAILTGEFEPEERLLEIPLSERIGVSRTPVRDALKRLADEQLVTITPGCGAKVARIVGKNAFDALDVRIAVESMTVRLAAQNIKEQQLSEMRELNDIFKQSFDSGDYTVASEVDNKLHRLICEASGNSVLLAVMLLLEDHVLRYRVEYIRELADCKQLVSEHEELITALEKRDGEKAEQIITAHIHAQKEKITQIINRKGEQK